MSILLPLPDKYIREALFSLINGIVVDGKTIKVYDYRVTGRELPSCYVLLSSQTNQVDKTSKCGDGWNSSILLDIVTRYDSFGNTGNRLLADEICNEIRALLEPDLVLNGGLNVVRQELDFPSDMANVAENQNVFRKFIRVELDIT